MTSRTLLDKGLSIFAPVDAGEGPTAVLLTLNLFLLMTAYYIIKPVRDSLILGVSGPEMKSYAGAAGAAAFLLVVPLYGAIANRVNRIQLINGVTAFFASNLVLFYLVSGFHGVGLIFFLWVGLFNLMIVAQFWAFTNDIYTQDQGRRLFAIIGIGSSMGSILGSGVAAHLFGPMGPYGMMLVAAGILIVCMILTNWVHHREGGMFASRAPAEMTQTDGAFRLVFKQRYLLLIASLIVLSNLVNTNGEFILGKTVIEHAKAAATLTTNQNLAQQEYIGRFYADYYFWVNLVGAALQMIAVSRVIRYAGIGPALLLLPIIALGGYTILSFAPMLPLVRLTKIAENGTDYSVQNTARHALFLRTDRESKYKGATAIDGFFWRAGDALSAGIVFIGTNLAFGLQGYAKMNVMLTGAWLCIAAAIVWLRLVEAPHQTKASIPKFRNARIRELRHNRASSTL